MSEAAEKELRRALGARESDTLSPITIEKKPFVEEVKALETSRQLPPDTPEDMKKWWWNNKISLIAPKKSRPNHVPSWVPKKISSQPVDNHVPSWVPKKISSQPVDNHVPTWVPKKNLFPTSRQSRPFLGTKKKISSQPVDNHVPTEKILSQPVDNHVPSRVPNCIASILKDFLHTITPRGNASLQV